MQLARFSLTLKAPIFSLYQACATICLRSANAGGIAKDAGTFGFCAAD